MRATLCPRFPTHLRPEGITKTLSDIGGDFLILSTSPYSSSNSHPLLPPTAFSKSLSLGVDSHSPPSVSSPETCI